MVEQLEYWGKGHAYKYEYKELYLGDNLQCGKCGHEFALDDKVLIIGSLGELAICMECYQKVMTAEKL